MYPCVPGVFKYVSVKVQRAPGIGVPGGCDPPAGTQN